MPSPLRALLLVIVLGPGLAIAIARDGRTLPLFSRELGSACSQCHTTFPRLSRAGIEFERRGYREADAAVSADAPRRIPFSVVGSASASFSRRASDPLGTPAEALEGRVARNALELRSAGAIGRHLSFAFGAGYADPEEDLEVGTASVQFVDKVSHYALGVRAGLFDAELPFLSQVRRTTLEPYLTPVTFDARGLELTGAAASWNWAAGLVSSDRKTSGAASSGRVRDAIEDTYWRIEHDVRGCPIAAQMLFDRQDSNLPAHAWLQHIRTELAGSMGPSRFTVIPGYVFDRFDDRPAAGIHEHHHYFLLETVALLDRPGRWALTTRYEQDYRTRNAIDPEEHRQLATADLALRVLPSVKLELDCSHSEDRLTRRGGTELQAGIAASY